MTGSSQAPSEIVCYVPLNHQQVGALPEQMHLNNEKVLAPYSSFFGWASKAPLCYWMGDRSRLQPGWWSCLQLRSQLEPMRAVDAGGSPQPPSSTRARARAASGAPPASWASAACGDLASQLRLSAV